MSKKSYYWIDVAKSIGIILVVLGHSIEYCESYGKQNLFIWNIVYDMIGSFHMPLFYS